MLETKIILLIAGIFFFTFIFWRILERVHIPWIFVALLLGIIGSFNPFIQETIHFEGFEILTFLAMNFFLFIIGFEIDLKQIKKLWGFIIKSSLFIILWEAVVLGILIWFVFNISPVIAWIIGLSFATVGEAILIPILDWLKVTKTKLWQAILWVATMDDVFEIIAIVLIAVILPTILHSEVAFSRKTIILPLSILASIIGLWLFLIHIPKKYFQIKEKVIKYKFFFTILIFFAFLGLGSIADMASIWAIMWGLVVSEILNKKDLPKIEHEVKNIAYYLLWPIFFFSVGAEVSIKAFIDYFGLILLFSSVPYLVKIWISYLNWRKKLGGKKAIYMWVALGIRFSTSIVILTLFLKKEIITKELFSILISTTIVLKFIIPPLLSVLAKKRNIWRFAKLWNKK